MLFRIIITFSIIAFLSFIMSIIFTAQRKDVLSRAVNTLMYFFAFLAILMNIVRVQLSESGTMMAANIIALIVIFISFRRSRSSEEPKDK